MRSLLLVSFLAACGGAQPAGPPQADECADAAQTVSMLSEDGNADLVAATEEECRASWTREELACVRRATTSDGVGACFRAVE